MSRIKMNALLRSLIRKYFGDGFANDREKEAYQLHGARNPDGTVRGNYTDEELEDLMRELNSRKQPGER